MTTADADPKVSSKRARERATAASEYVRHLRRILGQAMRDEAEALAAAREAERMAR